MYPDGKVQIYFSSMEVFSDCLYSPLVLITSGELSSWSCVSICLCVYPDPYMYLSNPWQEFFYLGHDNIFQHFLEQEFNRQYNSVQYYHVNATHEYTFATRTRQNHHIVLQISQVYVQTTFDQLQCYRLYLQKFTAIGSMLIQLHILQPRCSSLETQPW